MASFFDRITGVRQRVAIAIQDTPGQILEFDAALSETHIGNAVTSDHPVESGSDLTDHIQRTPDELQLLGLVSDTPLVFLASINGQPSVPGGDPKNRAQDAYVFLRSIKDLGQLVRVTTTLRDYENMSIIGLSVIRDKDKGRIVEAAISLREIQIATTEQVEAPEPVVAPRKKKTDQGKKQKTPAPVPEQKAKGILVRSFEAFGR